MEITKEMAPKEIIARRVAKFLKDGDFVNLGIGLPTEVAKYIPSKIEVLFQSENGMVGLTGVDPNHIDPDLTNAGGQPCGAIPGASFFDSATSFALIRGGHVDYTVLGALEVDDHGNLANWIIPGKMVPGMGGAMDLVVGAKTVIVAMQHTQKGAHKILKECTLPYTALHVVDYIVTEECVLKQTRSGLVLMEINPNYTVQQVQADTGATLIVPKNGPKTMKL